MTVVSTLPYSVIRHSLAEYNVEQTLTLFCVTSLNFKEPVYVSVTLKTGGEGDDL